MSGVVHRTPYGDRRWCKVVQGAPGRAPGWAPVPGGAQKQIAGSQSLREHEEHDPHPSFFLFVISIPSCL